MPKHRGHGEGSYTQREDGGWRVRITVNGRRLSHDASTKQDCQKWARKQHNDADRGLLPADNRKVKVADYLDVWLKTVQAAVKPRTLVNYTVVVQKHLKPKLGDIRLPDLKADHVQSLYSEKLASGAAPASVRNYHAVLHRALRDAMKWGRVSHNICDAVTAPRAEKKEMEVWSPEEARRFLEGVSGDRLEPLYRLTLSTGLRLGEVAGLKWEDVDMQTGTLQVKRTIQRLGKGTGLTVGTPKTAKGRRQLALSPSVVEAIRRWRVQQVQERLLAGRRWKDTAYLFTTRVGTPLEPRDLRQQFYNRVDDLGLPRITFHGLRHSAATILLSQGVHAKIAQEMLGHANISMTLDLYSHVLLGMQQEAARAMERVLA